MIVSFRYPPRMPPAQRTSTMRGRWRSSPFSVQRSDGRFASGPLTPVKFFPWMLGRTKFAIAELRSDDVWMFDVGCSQRSARLSSRKPLHTKTSVRLHPSSFSAMWFRQPTSRPRTPFKLFTWMLDVGCWMLDVPSEARDSRRGGHCTPSPRSASSLFIPRSVTGNHLLSRHLAENGFFSSPSRS